MQRFEISIIEEFEIYCRKHFAVCISSFFENFQKGNIFGGKFQLFQELLNQNTMFHGHLKIFKYLF